jgi:hypothetical protein
LGKLRWPDALLGRWKALLAAIIAFWTSRPLLLSVVVGTTVTVVAMGTARTLSWMETPDFCQRCHTMTSEVEAHAISPHRTVECTECHMSRGLGGFVKAKWDGAFQMVKLVTGTYARPIAAASHSMPEPRDTCLRCHNPERQHGDLLITRSYFWLDKANTEQRVAMVVRLSDDSEADTQGIHWHVSSEMEFLPSEEGGQRIDWVVVDRADGSRDEYISEDVLDISGVPGEAADEFRGSDEIREMTCYDCHNRVGHDFSTPDRALNEALSEGRIDAGIPFIKMQAMEVLAQRYESVEQADDAVRELWSWYHRTYPNLLVEKPAELSAAMGSIARIYRQTANPAMAALVQTYPSYLGHEDSAGCFRCHDGSHYKIEGNELTDEAIPSRCSLCHTFPSVGDKSPNVMIGPAPGTHEDPLWVFDHKDEAPSMDPAETNCAACHSQTYCSNCHSTGALDISHDDMYYSHAAVIREVSEQPCSYCHQVAFCERWFCERCHEEGVDW